MYASDLKNNTIHQGMGLVEARSFLLGAYHDLPNVLFMTSLILGSITGYLPLVWVALGLVINASIIAGFQGILRLIFPTWSQIHVDSAGRACEIIRSVSADDSPITVAPSHWLGSALFFATFSIYNSAMVGMRSPAKGVSDEKVDVRRAVSLSAVVIGIVFFTLILARGFSGCETYLGGGLGLLFGSGTAIGFWHMLDACGTGTIPDILQIVSGSAPAGSEKQTTIVCR